jgi:hypothetical protein
LNATGITVILVKHEPDIAKRAPADHVPRRRDRQGGEMNPLASCKVAIAAL